MHYMVNGEVKNGMSGGCSILDGGTGSPSKKQKGRGKKNNQHYTAMQTTAVVDSEQIIDHMKRFNHNSDTLHRLLVSEDRSQHFKNVNSQQSKGPSNNRNMIQKHNQSIKGAKNPKQDQSDNLKDYFLQRESSQDSMVRRSQIQIANQVKEAVGVGGKQPQQSKRQHQAGSSFLMTSQKVIHDSPSIVERLQVRRKTIQDVSSDLSFDEIDHTLDYQLDQGIDLGQNSLEDKLFRHRQQQKQNLTAKKRPARTQAQKRPKHDDQSVSFKQQKPPQQQQQQQSLRKSQVLSVLQIDKIPCQMVKGHQTEVKKTNIKGPLLKKSMIEMDSSQKQVKKSDLDSYMDIIGKKYNAKPATKKTTSKSLNKRRSNDVARILSECPQPTAQNNGQSANGAYPGIASQVVVDSEGRNLSTNAWANYKPKTQDRRTSKEIVKQSVGVQQRREQHSRSPVPFQSSFIIPESSRRSQRCATDDLMMNSAAQANEYLPDIENNNAQRAK